MLTNTEQPGLHPGSAYKHRVHSVNIHEILRAGNVGQALSCPKLALVTELPRRLSSAGNHPGVLAKLYGKTLRLKKHKQISQMEKTCTSLKIFVATI